MIKEANCLLFHCARYNLITPIVTMGLWGLADLLTKNGYETKIVHTGIEQEVHGAFDITNYLHDDLLLAGSSAHWFPMTAESIDILKEIKDHNPKTFTVLGGYSASYFAEEIMANYPWVDGVVRGDGEKPLLELVTKLKNGDRDFSTVPNLIWRSKEGIVKNEFSYVSTPEDLEGIEFANYSRYLHNYKHGKKYYFEKSSLVADFVPTEMPLNSTFYLLTGKGCPVNCSICGGGRDAQKIVNNRAKCMFLKKEQVIKTIKQAMEHGYRNMYVCFDPLPDSPRYFEYLEAIREENLDVDFSFGFWRLPTREVIHEFKKVTKNLLFDISPESISEDVRKVTKDAFYYSNEEMYNTLDMLYSEQVYTHVYFCYFLPGETIADLHANRKAFWEINTEYAHFIEAIYIKISTDPASPLYRNPEKYGVTLKVANLQEHLDVGRKVTNSNIHVHSINTVPEDFQVRFQKLISFDSGLKRVFKYHIKPFVKAFANISDFISYLDGFYEELDLFNDNTSQMITNQFELLQLLKKYSLRLLQQRQDLDPIIIDIIDYVESFNRVLESSTEDHTWKPEHQPQLKDCKIKLVQQAAIVELKHDVFKASNYLLEEKQIPTVEKRDNWLLFLNENGKVQTYEMNETLFELLTRFQKNQTQTIEEIVGEVVGLYTDDTALAQQIENELIVSITQLAQLGIFSSID